MKKSKYRKIGVVFIMLLLLMTAIFVPTYAAEDKKAEACSNEASLGEKYGINIDKVSGTTNNYEIYMDAGNSCLDTTIISVAEFQIISINNKEIINGGIVKNGQAATIEADLVTSGEKSTVTVSLKVTDAALAALKEKIEKSGATYKEEEYTETVTISYVIENYDPIIIDVPKEANTNYNGVCAIFRNGDINGYNNSKNLKDSVSQTNFEKYNYKNVSPDGKDYYETALSYCFQSEVVVNYTEEETVEKINNFIVLWKNYVTSNENSQEFNDVFNSIKNKAHSKGNFVSPEKIADTIDLKCNYDPKITTDKTNEYGDTILLDDYYKNKDYYYSEKTEESGYVKYNYNYSPGKVVPDEKKDFCERTCTEAVKVEYGPPVASKAGLCFEYKVKVTSYVNCTTENHLTPPKHPTNYCSPSPYCVRKDGTTKSGVYIHQAGPTEDFDKCIETCDGGKYTSKCSVNCYNKVYGSSGIIDISSSNSASVKNVASAKKCEYNKTITNSAVCACLAINPDGCYYKENGVMKWAGNFSKNNGEVQIRKNLNALGRWYVDKYKRKQYNLDGFFCDNCSGIAFGYPYGAINGIYTEFRNGVACSDQCVWQNNCGNNTYLNPGAIAADYKVNLEEYQKGLNACSAAATCSEHTAEFTISVNYDNTVDGVRKVNTIQFPYDTKEVLYANKENEAIGTNDRSIILAYDGCYDKTKSITNHYMTEWSFPGTYIHNKTGEISFTEPESPDGWYYDDKKFCLPLDAKSVNEKWWEWYKLGNTCYTTAEIEAELNGKAGTSNGYNITASAANFGYFGWNFDIKCFYGIKNEVCNIKLNGCCSTDKPVDKKEDNGTLNYTFRPIDTENMFPNAEDEVTEGTDKRKIGFNWTNKAKSAKNDKYIIDPIALREQIKNNATTLYSNNDNLDYEFYLTPSSLAKIKTYNKTTPYAVWEGEIQEINGINVYRSNLFRAADEGVSGTKVLSKADGEVIELGKPGYNNEVR